MTIPFDPGLQPERTALAWRRTALSMALTGAVTTRVAVGQSDGVAVSIAATAGVLAATSHVWITRRHRRVISGLVADGTLPRTAFVLVGPFFCLACMGLSVAGLHLLVAAQPGR